MILQPDADLENIVISKLSNDSNKYVLVKSVSLQTSNCTQIMLKNQRTSKWIVYEISKKLVVAIVSV